jgi:hypothetical protein
MLRVARGICLGVAGKYWNILQSPVAEAMDEIERTIEKLR